MSAWLGRIACALASRASAAGRLSRALAPHVSGCGACAGREAARERVERALLALAPGQTVLSPLLRARVADAVERETRRLGTPRAEAAAVGRLARATLAAGALATAALLGAVGASRVESWREPPRSVRILLPVGTRALGEPVIVVRRASGREERR